MREALENPSYFVLQTFYGDEFFCSSVCIGIWFAKHEKDMQRYFEGIAQDSHNLLGFYR